MNKRTILGILLLLLLITLGILLYALMGSGGGFQTHSAQQTTLGKPGPGKASDKPQAPAHEEELTYKTTIEWAPYPPGSEHTKNGVQYHDESDGIILRKVYLEDQKKIYVYGKNTERANIIIMFHVPCEENSEIETREKYGDGSPMILSCLHRKTGTFLSIAFEMPYSGTLKYNFGGFRVNEKLSSWGLDPIIRAHTLKTARKRVIKSLE